MKTQILKVAYKKYIGITAIILLLFLSILSQNFYNSYKKSELGSFEKLIKNIYVNKTLNSIFDSLEPRFEKKTYVVKQGDTLQKILNNHGLNLKERNLLLSNFKKIILRVYIRIKKYKLH